MRDRFYDQAIAIIFFFILDYFRYMYYDKICSYSFRILSLEIYENTSCMQQMYMSNIL